jgi:hypothetical protein
MDEKAIVDLKIRLRHDGLKQTDFFKSVVYLYLDHPDLFIDILEKIKTKESKFSKTRIAKSINLYKKGIKNMKDYNLSEEEKKSVFDILEHELGDL